MSAVHDRLVEYGMTHRMSGGGMAERYLRPDPVREIARRVQQWVSEPETCKGCVSRPVLSIRGGDALCTVCLAQKIQRFSPMEDAGVAPRAWRNDDDPKAPQFRGLGIVFNSRSEDLGGFVEIVKPSAADRMEAEKPDLRYLWNHDSAIPLGRVSAGTLRARKTSRGIAVEVDPPKWAANYVETVERRDVVGQSFGFMVNDDAWYLEDKLPVRELLDIEILEFSGVAFPAYPATTLEVVSAGTRSEWTRERETLTRIQLAR